MHSHCPTRVDSVLSYHAVATNLYSSIVTLCSELRYVRYAVLDSCFQKHPEADIAKRWIGGFKFDDDDIAELEAQILSKLAERLAELQKLLRHLRKSNTFLAAFAGNACRFQVPPVKGKRVPNCLAGKFLLDQRRKPPASQHAALMDLAVGCLDELGTTVPDPEAAANVAEQWSDAFVEVGGSWQQWMLALRAEKAQSRELDVELTEDQERQQFCFEKWQEGWSLKEINAELKKHPVWEHFEDGRAVRGPSNAWAKRIGVKPRSGRPGRRKSTD